MNRIAPLATALVVGLAASLAGGPTAALADSANPCNVSLTQSPTHLTFSSTRQRTLHVHVDYDEQCVATGVDKAADLQLLRYTSGGNYVLAYDLGVTSPHHDYTDVGVDANTGPGTYVWSLGVVTEADGSQYSLPEIAGFVAKDASRTKLTAKRAHGRTTLTVKATHFYAVGEETGDVSGYHVWRKAKVKLERKVGSSWRTIRTVTTNAKGVAKLTVKAGKHTYRAVSVASALYAGSQSKAVKK